MNRPKMTPGPWAYSSGMVWAGREETPIARMDRTTPATSPVERDANARAIAALPDLIGAAREVLAEFDADSADAAREQGCYGLNETGGIEWIRSVLARIDGGGE
jgi:hypothetical protein